MQSPITRTAGVARAHRRLPALRTLRHRGFRSYWLGFGAAVLGFQVQRVGLGFLAYDLTGSALLLALVFSGDSLPMILLSPLGGVAGDRLDRKTVLIGSRICVAALALAIAVLAAADLLNVWHLLLFALLTGVCYALDVPARQAMLPDLVPPADLVNAIALTATMRQASRIAGPALGGLALLLVGAQGTFLIMAVAQIVLVLALAGVRLPRREPVAKASVAADLADGARFILSQPVIRPLLVVSAVPALTAMAYQSLTPVFAESVLGRGGPAIGAMLSAAGVGALCGSLLVTAHPERVAAPGAAALAAALFGLAVAAFALSGNYLLSLALLVLAGLTSAVSSIGISSAIQRRTPPTLQGRVMGIYQTTWELQFAGAIAVGALADRIGAPTALAAAGILSAAIVGCVTIARFRPAR
jgi:MFS family permease